MSHFSQAAHSDNPLDDSARACVGSEGRRQMLTRVALGMAWALKPPRTLGVPATLLMVAGHYLGARRAPGALPDPESALRHPDGLVGICDDMSVDTMMRAYACGLFPWCHVAPMKWWAPSQRMILRPERYRIEKNLRRVLRQGRLRVTFDRDFTGVMRGCAEARSTRPHLTWIGPQMMASFTALHNAGYAHSVEAWDAEGRLVGGAYGLAVGGVFFTESQFARVRDASKAAFTVLNCHLQAWGFTINDGKHETQHLQQLGFEAMPRSDFNGLLAGECARPIKPGHWTVDAGLDTSKWRPDAGPESAQASA